jgi:hypothetical protein
VARAASAPAAAPPPPTTAPIAEPGQTYDLRFRPSVGLKWTYQIIADSDLRGVGTPDADNEHESAPGRIRVSLAVASEEVTEVRNGRATARRVTFANDCWTATADGGKKASKVPLFCAGTTFNVRIAPDGSLQTDSMLKPRPDENRRLRNAMASTGALFPGRPVAVGEQWRADEALRAFANLNSDDDVKAALKLQGVRQLNGRDVADVALIARVISMLQGERATINYRGALAIDLATGLTVKADLSGRVQITATSKNDKAKKMNLGNAKLAIHSLAYILAAPGSKAPVQSVAATPTTPQTTTTRPTADQASAADDEP